MLHLETVESNTLSILKRLMALPEIKSFFLVGGTALSLQYGHRISIIEKQEVTSKADELHIGYLKLDKI